MVLDNEKKCSTAAKAIENNVYMDDFIKSVENPDEAIEVFNQLQPNLSQHEFELMKWISNNDALTEANAEDLKSISNTKQVEVEPNAKGSSVLGLQWTVTVDNCQVCRGTNTEVGSPLTQGKKLSLVSSVFNPVGLFAPFSVYMRRLLKGIWSKRGQHWFSEVEPGDVAEKSIDRRYFNREMDKTELHVFADASDDALCAVAYLRSQPRKYSADLAFVIGICHWSDTYEASFNTPNGNASRSLGSEVEGTDSQGTRIDDKELQFLVKFNYSIVVDTMFPSEATRVCGQQSG